MLDVVCSLASCKSEVVFDDGFVWSKALRPTVVGDAQSCLVEAIVAVAEIVVYLPIGIAGVDYGVVQLDSRCIVAAVVGLVGLDEGLLHSIAISGNGKRLYAECYKCCQ